MKLFQPSTSTTSTSSEIDAPEIGRGRGKGRRRGRGRGRGRGKGKILLEKHRVDEALRTIQSRNDRFRVIMILVSV